MLINHFAVDAGQREGLICFARGLFMVRIPLGQKITSMLLADDVVQSLPLSH